HADQPGAWRGEVGGLPRGSSWRSFAQYVSRFERRPGTPGKRGGSIVRRCTRHRGGACAGRGEIRKTGSQPGDGTRDPSGRGRLLRQLLVERVAQGRPGTA